MRILDFTVSKQRIDRDPQCDFNDIASGTRGYLHARFRFSSDWNGCKRVVVFSCRGKDFPAPLVNNMCVIPAEALVSNTVKVGVVGLNDRTGYRITTNTVEFTQSTGR